MKDKVFFDGDGAPGFTVTLRGYDRGQVDALREHAMNALNSDSPALRAAARQALERPTLNIRLRGYAVYEVDTYLARLAAELAEG